MTAPTLSDAEAVRRRAKQSESEGNQQAAWIGRWSVQNISKQGWAQALGHASKWRNENFIVFVPQVLEKVSHFDCVFAYIKQRLSVFFGHAQLDKVTKAAAPPPVFQYTCHTHFALGTGSANRAQFSTRLFSLWSVARLKALASPNSLYLSLAVHSAPHIVVDIAAVLHPQGTEAKPTRLARCLPRSHL